MKKTFLIITVLSSLTAMSQEIQIYPYACFFMGGRLNGYEADVLFDQGPGFGAGASYGLGRGKNLELSYTFAASSGVARRNDTGTYSDETNMTFGYIQAGYVQDIILRKAKHDIRPFALVTLGAAYLNPENGSYTTAWRFAGALGGGLKYFITDRIGLRVQARLLLPFFFSGAGFYCGTGGCGTYTDSFTSLAQGDIGGGVVIKLGEDR